MSRATGPRCVFRVAAGPRIGFGHLLRARALARACGAPAVASVRGGLAAQATARALGFRLVNRAADLLAHGRVLVVDDPCARQGREWIRRAKAAGLTSVGVQDAGIGVRDADLTIDGSAAACAAAQTGRSLTGSSFCILDPAVTRARQLPRRSKRRRRPVVLVSLGGGRQVRSHAARIVREIGRLCPEVSIRVAAGMSAGPLPRLPYGRWIVCRAGLSRALRAADVAVVGGGITLYEACAIGTPAVATAVVPAQAAAIDAVVRAAAALDGGQIGVAPAAAAHKVAASVAWLVQSRIGRAALAANGRRLVDGGGAVRVVRQIGRMSAAVGSREAGHV